jgi:hypothetical protein
MLIGGGNDAPGGRDLARNSPLFHHRQLHSDAPLLLHQKLHHAAGVSRSRNRSRLFIRAAPRQDEVTDRRDRNQRERYRRYSAPA